MYLTQLIGTKGLVWFEDSVSYDYFSFGKNK